MLRKYVLCVLVFPLICRRLVLGGAELDEPDPRDTPLVQAIQKAQPAVAAIYVRKGRAQGSGSGSVIDPRGYVLTAQHVVGDADGGG